MASQLKSKNFERQFNEYLSKLIYAVFNDIAGEWNGPIKHSPMIYQNYPNLLLEKESRLDNLKSRFTISSEVRQFITILFSKMIEEFTNIQMLDGDTIATITEKLTQANTECYASFMFGIAARYKREFGNTLKSAGDPSMWLHNQIVGFLPQYAIKPVLIALVSNEFDNFIRAIAWLFGKLLWYYEVSVSGELFLGMLAQQGLQQVMLDELSSGLRAKPPTKPRKKSDKTPANKADSPPLSAPVDEDERNVSEFLGKI